MVPFVSPPAVAVMATPVETLTGAAFKVTGASRTPAGMNTLAGAGRTAGDDELRYTVVPPVGAGPVNRKVRVILPPATLVVDGSTAEIWVGVPVKGVVTTAPGVDAETVRGVFADT